MAKYHICLQTKTKDRSFPMSRPGFNQKITFKKLSDFSSKNAQFKHKTFLLPRAACIGGIERFC